MLKCNLKNQESYPILKKHQIKKAQYGTTSGSADSDSCSSISDDEVQPISYPFAVIFVLVSKTFEAFAANGVRTVLALYMRDSLHFSEEYSTTLLHIFNFFSQFCPIFGAIIADSYWGNTKTIFFFCIPYAIGYFLLFFATLPTTLSFGFLIYISLLLVSVGNGNLRACIAALGGHQFKLPQQKPQLDRYFSIYYFTYTMGILLSKVVPPEVRVSFHCFGKSYCYTAVFAMLALVFLVSWFFFMIGMLFYRKEVPTDENVLAQVFGCVLTAIKAKLRGTTGNRPWIQGAIGNKYSKEFVDDVSAFLKVLKLFIPLPIYWALLAQQDSTWTFQATMLNTTVGSFYIQPDQVKALGPISLLILIPLWQRICVPLLNRRNFQLTSLESVSLGGICAACSFLCSGFLQIAIEQCDLEPPSVLWQIPQFVFLMMGEVLLAIPGLKFSYTQAPKSMKSVLTAAWFINNAIGNLIVVAVTEIHPIETQSVEFFFYAAWMFLGIICFTILASNYKFVSENFSDEQIISFAYVDAISTSNMDENDLTESSGVLTVYGSSRSSRGSLNSLE